MCYKKSVPMEEERQYLNVLKGLLIVLVVIGHFGQTIANNLPSDIAFVGQGIVLFIYFICPCSCWYLVTCQNELKNGERWHLWICLCHISYFRFLLVHVC